jgi:F-type H+-transporting ATPase subunit gamma
VLIPHFAYNAHKSPCFEAITPPFTGRTDYCLFSALHAAPHTTLMAENHSRVEHLEGAVHHMEEKAMQPLSHSSALRRKKSLKRSNLFYSSLTW